MKADESIVQIGRWKLRAGIKRDAKRRRMRLHLLLRTECGQAPCRLNAFAPIDGTPLPDAIGPAVVAAGLDDVDFLRRLIVTQAVTAVVEGPEVAGERVPGEID